MTQLTHQTEGVLPEVSAQRLPLRTLLADVAQMTKPRITLMVIITAYIGYAIGFRQWQIASDGVTAAAATQGFWLHLLATLAGTGLSCTGASAFNQVLERDVDALMPRTMNRPLPAGRMNLTAAVGLALSLSIGGVMVLTLLSGLLPAALAAFTIASYVLIYTPMKRISSVSTIIGAVPGALPPVIGYAAATGELGPAAWALFAILFLWQLPHFLAIAWLYRDDYAAAGMPMLPVIDREGHSTSRQVLAGCCALVPLGLMPTALGISGMIYFVGALLAGLVFLGFGIVLALHRTRRNARALFFASLVYLPLVFTLMLVDQL